MRHWKSVLLSRRSPVNLTIIATFLVIQVISSILRTFITCTASLNHDKSVNTAIGDGSFTIERESISNRAQKRRNNEFKQNFPRSDLDLTPNIRSDRVEYFTDWSSDHDNDIKNENQFKISGSSTWNWDCQQGDLEINRLIGLKQNKPSN